VTKKPLLTQRLFEWMIICGITWASIVGRGHDRAETLRVDRSPTNRIRAIIGRFGRLEKPPLRMRYIFVGRTIREDGPYMAKPRSICSGARFMRR